MDIGSLTGKLVLEDQMSAVLKVAEDALTKFSSSATGSAEKMTNLGTSMTSVGKAVTALSIPFAVVGGAALAAGYSIEGAYNTIARKTGETGEALQGLKKDFEAVFSSVPNSAQEVATAIADVHQRLGLTGEELQTVTKRFIDFANVNQTDVATATKTVSTLMGALSEGTKLTAEEIGNASSIMDKLTYASQVSGASVGKLAEGVIKGGVAFVNMGFGIDESLALFAQFEKVGANVNDVTASLGRVMAKLAKEGVTDLSGAFKGLVTEIHDAPTYADSLRKSIETFGSIAGPKLAEEIRGGTYSVEELAKTLKGLKGTTDATAKASQSFTEDLGTLKNQMTLALAPLGIEMIDAIKKFIPAMKEAIEWVAKLVEWFGKLPQSVQTFVFLLGGVVVAVGPVIIALGSMYEKFLLLGGAKGVAYVGGLLADFGVTAALTSAAINVAIGAGVVGLFIGLGLALWELGKAIKNAYEWFQSGKPMWDFFTQQDDNNFVRRFLRYVGVLEDVNKEIGFVGPIASDAQLAFSNLHVEVNAGEESFDMYAARMNKMRSDAMQPLSKQVQADIKEMHDLSYEVEKIAQKTGASVPAVKRFIEQLDAGEKAAEAFSKQLAELGGKTALAGAKEIVKQLGAMGGPLNVLPSKLKSMATALEAGAEAALNMGDANLAGQYTLLAKTLDPMIMFQQKYNITLRDFAIVAPTVESAAADMWEQFHRLSGEVIVIGDLMNSMDLSKLMIPYKDLTAQADTPDIGLKWKEQIGDLGKAFGDMFDGVNSQVGQVFKVMGSGLDFVMNKAESTNQKMSAIFAMGAGVLSAVLGPDGGGKWGGAATGALSGAAAGAMFGGVGAAVGAAVGAVAGWIGATKKAAEAQKEATGEVKKLEAALVDQYGSLENLEDISMRLFGMSFVGEWGNQGVEGLKKMQEFTKDFEARLASVKSAIENMSAGFMASTAVLTDGLSVYSDNLTKAQENYDKLKESGTATDEQLVQATAAVTDALNAQFDAGQANKQMLDDLGVQGIATFSAIYMATGSYTEALAAVAPTMATLGQAYADLGLQVDNVLLSHLTLQAGVLEANPSLMAAIDGQAGAMQGMAQMGLLNAETFAAMQRTGIELYRKLQDETNAQAAATGDLGDHTVDALMPMQQYLHEATVQADLLGIPLDANTEMLIEQSKELGIWKEAGATAQDKLIAGMDQLVGKLDQMLSNLGAMTGLLTNMPNAESTVTVNHVDRYQSVFLPDVHEGETQYRAGGGLIYAAGGFNARGTDTVPAMLTPGERVLTTSENREYEKNRGGDDKQTDQMAGSIDRLTDALLGQNEAMILAMRDMILERG